MSGKEGRFKLRDRVNRLAEAQAEEKKSEQKPRKPPKPPAVEGPAQAKKGMTRVQTGLPDLGAILQKNKKEQKPETAEGASHDLGSEEQLSEVLISDESIVSEVEKKFDGLFEGIGTGGLVMPAISDTPAKDPFADLVKKDDVVPIAETYEEFRLPVAEMPESELPVPVETDDATENLSSMDVEDESELMSTDDIIEDEGVKPPPLPQQIDLPDVDTEMPSPKDVEEESEPTTGEMETKDAATGETEKKPPEIEMPPLPQKKMPEAPMPDSQEKEEVSDEAETRAASTKSVPTKIAEKKLMPQPQMPASEPKEEIADTEETRAIVTKAAEAGVKVENKTELQILLTLERRFKRWGLVDKMYADVSMEDAIMSVLKNNHTLLAAIVSGLIKNNDEVRNIIFNEQSRVLGEMRTLHGQIDATKKEIEGKIAELKSLRASVEDIKGAAREAKAAAEKAEGSASEVVHVRSYVDEKFEALAEAVDEELNEKTGALAKAVDEELNEKLGSLGSAVDDELEDVRSSMRTEIDEKAKKAKEDAVEEAKSHADTQIEAAKEEALRDAREYADGKVSEGVKEAEGETLKAAGERISDAIEGIRENTIEPIQNILKAVLGNRYEKAPLAKEMVEAAAVTAVVGALSDPRYIEAVDAFGREYGRDIAKDALESIRGMGAERLAMSEQIYNDRGELDVEKAESIINRANKILNK